ncbi:MAG: hypothetical protein LQ343_005134 [Gyalolechia ehrenbergii]|nr:MAG: hypothetical protein LQ343_005134 [Gyalolechia ehrenbergii]
MEKMTITDAERDKGATKTYLLVVNGQTEPADTALMGDWMGFCKVFRERGNFGGDFWTAMDPDHMLEKTGFQDIKFGRTTSNREKGTAKDDWFESLVMYKKGEHTTNAWFDVEDPRHITNRTMRWIHEKSKVAERGDAVIIILCGHGGKEAGALRLGTDQLLPRDFVKAIAAFKRDVQVSVIYNGCYSGYFKEAIEEGQTNERRFVHTAAAQDETAAADVLSPSGPYRNSPFARAWVQSMIGVTLPRGRNRAKSTIGEKELHFPNKGVTIMSHLQGVDKAVSRRHDPKHASHSQLFFSSPQLSWTDMLSKALFRKYVDVAWDVRTNSLRRRIESHAAIAIQASISQPLHPSQQAIDAGMFLCDQVNKTLDDQPMMTETGLWGASSTSDRRHRSLPFLLLNLYWRTRKQMAIFEVFVMLYQHGHLSAKALSIPVLYSRTSNNVRNVLCMLDCFEKLADLSNPPPTNTEWNIYEFEHGTHWLAVMICRCCHDLDQVNDVISLIAHSQRLGRLSASAVDEVNENYAQEVRRVKAKMASDNSKGKGKGKQKEMEPAPFFVMNETENATDKATTPIFGLLLPSGKGSDIHQLFDDADKQFLKVEKVFKDFFGVSDQVLAMDDEGNLSGGNTPSSCE